MIDFTITSAELFPFFIALALWALVWCEREVSYRMRGDQEEEDDQFGWRAFAGTRSFALIALFGWLMGFFSSIDVAGWISRYCDRLLSLLLLWSPLWSDMLYLFEGNQGSQQRYHSVSHLFSWCARGHYIAVNIKRLQRW
jgi:hypothetical protein